MNKKVLFLFILSILIISSIFIMDKNTSNTISSTIEENPLEETEPNLSQLKKLKIALSNPLEQYMSIVFIGDSITWGLTATGNPEDYASGRDGTLSDRRDDFDSQSFVNEFKRYIGSEYMDGSAPLLSNWSESPSGESIVEYQKEVIVFPEGENFEVGTEGDASQEVQQNEDSVSGKQLNFDVSEGTGFIRFRFTGKEFTLSFDSTENSLDYELLIDGVSQGIFPASGDGYDNRRTHSFDYVKDALIEIKTVKNDTDGQQTLKIGGIIVNKTIKISNQGIIGATTRSYVANNLEGNTMGDGNAINDEDQYLFIQLGTNDRIIANGVEKGAGEFKKNLQLLLDEVNSNRNLILMCPNPAANNDPGIYSFDTKEVCKVITQVAQENGIDLIDNYSIFEGMDTSKYLADGLHPNDYGHQMMFQNIIDSLEKD
ncbi:SGNH/GDSL hydrolase family protein [Bacillus litorisediminis]|uniref:SGNH/GDSL hydrolase family protein n=1 Tax=Bacillus litorisediminis TaxID=2922713 RepID=UPI001FADABBC|nr:SGNH/GDSL hydrolase family protein [Bacillus litorisediminis]